MSKITEEMLDGLRERISQKMSPKRLAHTIAVEDMTARLCDLFCPEKKLSMRAAALLHDITKELPTSEQLSLCKAYGLTVTDEDVLAYKTLHARTAAAIIPSEYPEFADPMIVDAVRWHTTGRRDMTLTEQILYFADYIDATRTFDSCVLLRERFWNKKPMEMDGADRIRHFKELLLLSFDMTIGELVESNFPISSETVAARNQLIVQLTASHR